MHIHTETSRAQPETEAALFTWQICQTYRIREVSAYAAACAPLGGAWASRTSCWDVSATGFCMETRFQIFTR